MRRMQAAVAVMVFLTVLVIGGVPANAVVTSCQGVSPLDNTPTTGPDNIVDNGTSSEDVFAGDLGDDDIEGRGLSDVLCGNGDQDSITGGAADDNINAGASRDPGTNTSPVAYVSGDAGNDSISGGAGGDLIDGGDNNDVLHGDDDNDTIKGGPGMTDFGYGDAGTDFCDAEVEIQTSC